MSVQEASDQIRPETIREITELVRVPYEDALSITPQEAMKRAIILLRGCRRPVDVKEYEAGIIRGVTEDQVGDHPLKEALERIDKQPTKLGTILMSTETARSLGADVPESAPVDVEEMRIGDHVTQVGRCIDVALWYPDSPRSINTIMVSLVDVRAADSLLISYDKARDGWSIKQASTFVFDVNDTVCDPDWQEVAFIQAWAREKT